MTSSSGMGGLVTIGVYGWNLEQFLDALAGAEVRTVLDVRARRGVRGPVYVWANARRLIAALTEAEIGYAHLRELAPSDDLRQALYRDDARRGVGKRNRTVLPEEYWVRYAAEVLDRVGPEPVLEQLPPSGSAALLCVERDPEACHRSLIAARLESLAPIDVRHLRPPG